MGIIRRLKRVLPVSTGTVKDRFTTVDDRFESTNKAIDEVLEQLNRLEQLVREQKLEQERLAELNNRVLENQQNGFDELGKRVIEYNRQRFGEINKRFIGKADGLNGRLESMASRVISIQDAQSEERKSSWQQHSDEMDLLRNVSKSLSGISENIFKNREQGHECLRAVREVLYAESFRSVTTGCDWLEGASFSPGRWAVGYQFLFALYHVLNDFGPKSVLDLGLGQTTNMVGRYAKAHQDVGHVVVEHDPKWVEFYDRENGLPEGAELLRLDLAKSDVEGSACPVTTYDGFEDAMQGRVFDLIMIDAPFGTKGEGALSRVDALSLIPDHLCDTFVIMFDDYDRAGEQRTVQRMRELLQDAGIEYAEGVYMGVKKTALLCSRDVSFLTSL